MPRVGQQCCLRSGDSIPLPLTLKGLKVLIDYFGTGFTLNWYFYKLFKKLRRNHDEASKSYVLFGYKS